MDDRVCRESGNDNREQIEVELGGLVGLAHGPPKRKRAATLLGGCHPEVETRKEVFTGDIYRVAVASRPVLAHSSETAIHRWVDSLRVTTEALRWPLPCAVMCLRNYCVGAQLYAFWAPSLLNRIHANPKVAAKRASRWLFRRAAGWFCLRNSAGAFHAAGQLRTPGLGDGERPAPEHRPRPMVQTHNGFIWLGTEVGLVRFDGSSFAVFDRNSSPALPDSDIQCLLETATARCGLAPAMVWPGGRMAR